MVRKNTDFDASEVLPDLTRELIGAAALAGVLRDMFQDQKDLHDFFSASSYGLSAISNEEQNAFTYLEEIVTFSALLKTFYKENFDGLELKERSNA